MIILGQINFSELDLEQRQYSKFLSSVAAREGARELTNKELKKLEELAEGAIIKDLRYKNQEFLGNRWWDYKKHRWIPQTESDGLKQLARARRRNVDYVNKSPSSLGISHVDASITNKADVLPQYTDPQERIRMAKELMGYHKR